MVGNRSKRDQFHRSEKTYVYSFDFDALFAPRNGGTARTSGQVSFTHAGYEIIVASDRAVDVKPIDKEK